MINTNSNKQGVKNTRCYKFVLIIVSHSLTLGVGWPHRSHRYRQLYFNDASM